MRRVVTRHTHTSSAFTPSALNGVTQMLLDAGSTAEYISQKIFKHRIYLTILTKSMGATS
jgi:hypothetical protein